MLLEKYKKTYHIEDLNVKPQEYHDPFLLTDCEKWIDVLHANKEKHISIQGDYDPDGVCASTIFSVAFDIMNIGKSVYNYAPFTGDGYGLTIKSIKNIMAKHPNTELIVTCDNGIVVKDAVDFANRKNIDVLVSDHHLGKTDGFPDNALAVVNPNRVDKDELYPFKDISGAAVAHKLMLAYAKKYCPDKLELVELLKYLVGITVVSDVMPQIDENRRYIIELVDLMNDYAKLSNYSENEDLPSSLRNVFNGLYALSLHSALDGLFSVKTLGWLISPILNSARKMTGDCSPCIELFASDSVEAALNIIEHLVDLNTQRKEMSANQFNKAFSDDPSISKFRHIIYYNGEFKGTLGEVASKFATKYKRPYIILTENSSDVSLLGGSGRSYQGYNLHQALTNISKRCPHIIRTWGGHAMACGIEINSRFLLEFSKELEKEFDYVPITSKDDVEKKYLTFTEEELASIDNDFIEDLEFIESLRPYSNQLYPAPTCEVEISLKMDVAGMSDNKHIRINVNPLFQIVGWHKYKDIMTPLLDGEVIKVRGILETHYYRKKTVQLILN